MIFYFRHTAQCRLTGGRRVRSTCWTKTQPSPNLKLLGWLHGVIILEAIQHVPTARYFLFSLAAHGTSCLP